MKGIINGPVRFPLYSWRRLFGNQAISKATDLFKIIPSVIFLDRVTHLFIQQRAGGRQSDTLPNQQPTSLLPLHFFLHGHSDVLRAQKEQSEQS